MAAAVELSRNVLSRLLRGACRTSSNAPRVTLAGDDAADGAAVMASIEQSQSIRKRDPDGAPLVYYEQWVKFMNDMVREKVRGSKASGGFKWPF